MLKDHFKSLRLRWLVLKLIEYISQPGIPSCGVHLFDERILRCEAVAGIRLFCLIQSVYCTRTLANVLGHEPKSEVKIDEVLTVCNCACRIA